MKLDSVLELKQEIISSLQEEAEEKSYSTETLVNPNIGSRLAIGYSKKGGNEYQLELRIQRRGGKASDRAEEIRKQAKDEANIEVVREIEIPTRKAIEEATSKVRKLTKPIRPLHIGLSVGHTDGGAGTLGAFVYDKNDDICILSNNHVLALMGRAKDGDPIFQPGRPDQIPLLSDYIIGQLAGFAIVSRSDKNSIDSALAKLGEDIDCVGNVIPKNLGFPSQGKKINAVPNDESILQYFQKDEIVCKIGRTTGFTEGVVSAIAVDNVPVRTQIGNVVFDDVIEITWISNRKPFSKPGDSGSLVFTKTGLIAFGLHFAGGDKRTRRGRQIGVSYSCNIAAVLKAHQASLLD